MKKKPVRLQKKEEKKPLIENGLLFGVPIEFIMAIAIVVIVFLLIMVFVGPTDSGNWYNHLNDIV